MKILFSIADLERYKFKSKKTERVLVLDFKNLWFKYKSRTFVSSHPEFGPYINTDNGEIILIDYHYILFFDYTLAKINLKELKKSWFNSFSKCITKIPLDEYKKLEK